MTANSPVRKVKLRFDDLKALGLVGSRYDLHKKIKRGAIPKPHKDGDSQQATAWWWDHEIDDLIASEKRAAAG